MASPGPSTVIARAMAWAEPSPAGVGQTSGPPSPPNGVPAGKVPPPRKLPAIWGKIRRTIFFCLYADRSIFPSAESVFGFFLSTSHDEWRRADYRLECGRSIRA